MGLPNAGQISRIRIHPQDHDIAYIGVQGQIWGPSGERGVYRTTNGGESWEQVLSVDAQTGATDLRMDPTNPHILYASMWEHGRTPWFVLSGGRAGGIFKSTDGGDTWNKLTNGLPEFIGKVGVDVSASNPDRLYAIVEASPGEGGLYRKRRPRRDLGAQKRHAYPLGAFLVLHAYCRRPRQRGHCLRA